MNFWVLVFQLHPANRKTKTQLDPVDPVNPVRSLVALCAVNPV
jgi:hypothetical protein